MHNSLTTMIILSLLATFPGVDINLAAACSELQFLASPVSSHIQSAEQNNQAVNSLALISARYSIQSISTLQQLLAWTLYLLCQALDLRALQRRTALHLEKQIRVSISKHFSTWIGSADQEDLAKKVFVRLNRRMDETSARDLEARLMESYMSAGFEILRYFADLPSGGGADPLRNIMKWREESVVETSALYRKTALEVSVNRQGKRRSAAAATDDSMSMSHPCTVPGIASRMSRLAIPRQDSPSVRVHSSTAGCGHARRRQLPRV